MADNTEITLEERFALLDNIVENLESAETPLAEAFELYKTGIDMLNKCNEEIDCIEKQVLKLRDNGETDEF